MDQKSYISNYLESFQRALWGPQFSHPTKGYAKYIDVDSFVDYFLHTESTTNLDGYISSVYLSKDEGGRHTPFFNNYRPQFYFRTTDVTGVVHLPEGKDMVMPGDNTDMRVELIQPVAMDEGLRFAIREGGRTVGAGRVTKILN